MIETITYEQHQEFGRTLKKLEKCLYEQLDTCKTKKEKHNSNEEKALKYLGRLKDKMDNIVCRNKEYSTKEVVNVYYGVEETN
jgi:hypothetical protein